MLVIKGAGKGSISSCAEQLFRVTIMDEGNITIQCNIMFQFLEILYDIKDYEQRTN
jgi:hypothetical protein